MPFDGTGAFNRIQNWQNDRDANINIQASRMDVDSNDFANAFNQTFLRSGIVGMQGNLNLNNNRLIGLATGAANNLSIRFSADTTTGVYLNGAGRLAFAASATRRFEVNTTGAEVIGNLEVTGTTTLEGNVGLDADLDVAGDLTVVGNFTVAGTITLTAPIASAEITGTLEVGGDSSLEDVNISGTLTVVGNSALEDISASGTLTVVGNSALEDVSVSGELTVVGVSTLSVVNVSGNLNVDGTATLVALNATDNISTTGRMLDAIGDVRRLVKSPEIAGVLTGASANRVVRATGGITIDDGVFAENDSVMVINKSGGSITITQAAGMTLTNDTGAIGNRTLANHGIATIWFNTDNDAVIFGAGLT